MQIYDGQHKWWKDEKVMKFALLFGLVRTSTFCSSQLSSGEQMTHRAGGSQAVRHRFVGRLLAGQEVLCEFTAIMLF
jgi:hypothetical protein